MGKMRFGLHQFLEDEANRLLAESVRGTRSWAERSDILSPSQEARRRRREVLVSSGTPDPALRRGSFHRAANVLRPDLNSRDGVAARPDRVARLTSPTAEWVSGYLNGGGQ